MILGFQTSKAIARCVAAFIFAVAVQPSHAQTMVPKLDVEGRRGDVARMAKQRALEKFDAADTDKDGKLSRQEVEEKFSYLAEKFNVLDKNGDGYLSWEEYVGHDRWPK
jgi:hypothetical protein